MRAVVADQSVFVGKGRRAEDCPPYLRRCVNLNVNCYRIELTQHRHQIALRGHDFADVFAGHRHFVEAGGIEHYNGWGIQDDLPRTDLNNPVNPMAAT